MVVQLRLSAPEDRIIKERQCNTRLFKNRIVGSKWYDPFSVFSLL